MRTRNLNFAAIPAAGLLALASGAALAQDAGNPAFQGFVDKSVCGLGGPGPPPPPPQCPPGVDPHAHHGQVAHN